MVRTADCQTAYFHKADRKRFCWMTRNALMRHCQQTLLCALAVPAGQRVLEIGCGEGANLYALSTAQAGLFGIDLYEQKLRFAGQHNDQARFAAADAACLPFSDNSFDLVFCKDVLHHIERKDSVVSEMVRVCRPGGRVVAIEANGAHPLWRIFGSIIPAEQGVKKNSIRSLSALLNAYQPDARKMVCDFIFVPLACVFMTHYKFGWPALGNTRVFLKCCSAAAACAKKIIPRAWYPYILVSIVKDPLTGRSHGYSKD